VAASASSESNHVNVTNGVVDLNAVEISKGGSGAANKQPAFTL